MIRASGFAERVLLTDDDGRFDFRDLPAGSYAVTADKAGWVTGYYGSPVPWKQPAVPIALAEGEVRTELEVQLTPGGVLTGRLVDEFGQPQANARVIAFVRGRYAGSDTFQARPSFQSYNLTQLTDDLGRFRIFGLPPGDYIVGAQVQAGVASSRAMTTPDALRWAEQVRRRSLAGAGPPPPRGPSLAYQPIYYPGTAASAEASIVTVGPGEERGGLDFAVRFVPSSAVSGTLSLPDGAPASGVTLQLSTPNAPVMATMLLTSSIGAAARSRPDGSFTFTAVPPGDYVLTARSSGAWAEQPLSVGTDEVEGIDVRLQPGLTVSGRLTFPGTAPPPPERVQRLALGVLPADADASRPATVQARTNGTFEISGLTPGRYILTSDDTVPVRAGESRWIAVRAEVGGRNALEEPFDVAPGGDITGVVVEYSNRPAALSGTVSDEAGRPVRGLLIVLFPADPTTWAGPGGQRLRQSVSLDENGRYRLDGLSPGNYLLAAVVAVDAPDLADAEVLEQLAATAIRITLGLGETKVQDVRIGG